MRFRVISALGSEHYIYACHITIDVRLFVLLVILILLIILGGVL